MNLLIAAVATFVACFVLVPAIFWLLRFFGVYAIVEERTCNVYVLFAKVVADRFERSEVRRSEGCCDSVAGFLRKARAAGEGIFYLPLGMWPAETERMELRKPWVVMS